MLLDVASGADEVIKEASKLIEMIEGFLPKVFDFAVNVIIALILLFVGRIVIKYIIKFMDKFLKRANVEISVQKFLDSLIKVILYFSKR